MKRVSWQRLLSVIQSENTRLKLARIWPTLLPNQRHTAGEVCSSLRYRSSTIHNYNSLLEILSLKYKQAIKRISTYMDLSHSHFLHGGRVGRHYFLRQLEGCYSQRSTPGNDLSV
jgi:hypothetical protein